MATANQQQSTTGSKGSETSGVGSPISNEAYDVVSALAAKLEGLEAYRKYARDGNEKLWQELTSVELQSVESLVGALERLVKDGKFRLHEPGQTS